MIEVEKKKYFQVWEKNYCEEKNWQWINFVNFSFYRINTKAINQRELLWQKLTSIVMWKKFDMDIKFDCDMECGFVPPPDFSIPPPPLPPYLKELPKCSEESSSEFEMCSLIPVSQQSAGELCKHWNIFSFQPSIASEWKS